MRETGIEPVSTPWKGVTLPLCYSRSLTPRGVDPRTSWL